MSFTLIDGGSFTSDGTTTQIPLPGSCDYFVTTNVSKMGGAGSDCVRGEWYGSKFGSGASASNDGLRWTAVADNAIEIDKFSTSTASDGFTYVTTAPTIEAQASNAITDISKASSAVVSQTNTYSDGDIIQFYGTTGMLQIAGMNFEISSSSGSGYTLKGLDSSGFATVGTAGFTRRISKMLAVNPQYLYVTKISKANQAVVTTSVDPTNYYVVGMKVHFSVPYSFGMTEINQLTGTIVSMSSANYTMTVDIDSSAFSTFAFPASTESPTAQLFATVAPAGASTTYDPVTEVQTGYNFQFQPFRTGQFTPYMSLGAGANSPAGESGNNINWMAYRLV